MRKIINKIICELLGHLKYNNECLRCKGKGLSALKMNNPPLPPKRPDLIEWKITVIGEEPRTIRRTHSCVGRLHYEFYNQGDFHKGFPPYSMSYYDQLDEICFPIAQTIVENMG